MTGEQDDSNGEDFITKLTNYYLQSNHFNGLTLRLGDEVEAVQDLEWYRNDPGNFSTSAGGECIP